MPQPVLERVIPVLMCRDVPTAVAFYARLGFELLFQDDPQQPRYAGIRRDGIDLHLQWHDAQEWEYPNDRPTYRFILQDIDGLFEQFRERGVLNPNSVLGDTPWGTREFHVQDPDRNGLQFYRRR